MGKLIFLKEAETTYIQGSGKKPYEVKKVGGVVSCSCPAWRNLGGSIDTRICKHIKANIDPDCLLPQAKQLRTKIEKPEIRLTKTGKISKAVTGAVKKDTAPPCLLAWPWDLRDPTDWWMSEKLDGVRAWWDGTKFISRLGNEFHAPEWFKKIMPKDIVLDGELWAGRKQFQKTISAVRKLIPTDSEWLDLTFMIFDAPEIPGKFEDRQKVLSDRFPIFRTNGAEGVGHICVLEQIKCLSLKHMQEFLALCESFGGEGIMIREPESLYEDDRSWTCQKVKSFFDDEAKVVGYTNGRGKNKGRVGALNVEWKGKEFDIGTGLNDEDRKNPPAIGSIISFRYTELTNAGIPRFGRYLAERNYE
jgi:DNA ligase-1